MDKNNIYYEFFESRTDIFDCDLKIAVFLEGVFVQKLLNLPEQKSKSFYSRLNGLKLNEKLVKRIFTEAINKLNEYKKAHYYRELEKLIAFHFANSNFSLLNNDELSYYFVLGMNLVDEFKIEEENKTNMEDEDNE